MAKTAIGTAMIEVMQENDITRVMWGDPYALDVAFSRSGSKAAVSHPLDRWQVVLNALARDERFEQFMVTIDLWIGNCWRKRSVRVFKVKQSALAGKADAKEAAA